MSYSGWGNPALAATAAAIVVGLSACSDDRSTTAGDAASAPSGAAASVEARRREDQARAEAEERARRQEAYERLRTRAVIARSLYESRNQEALDAFEPALLEEFAVFQRRAADFASHMMDTFAAPRWVLIWRSITERFGSEETARAYVEEKFRDLVMSEEEVQAAFARPIASLQTSLRASHNRLVDDLRALNWTPDPSLSTQSSSSLQTSGMLDELTMDAVVANLDSTVTPVLVELGTSIAIRIAVVLAPVPEIPGKVISLVSIILSFVYELWASDRHQQNLTQQVEQGIGQAIEQMLAGSDAAPGLRTELRDGVDALEAETGARIEAMLEEYRP